MAINTSTDFYSNDTQAGLNDRLAQMQGINAAGAPVVPSDTSQTGYKPSVQADATGTLPGQTGYNQGLSQSSGVSDLIDKVNKAGTRTERAAYGGLLNTFVAQNPGSMSVGDMEAQMKKAGTRTARAAFGQGMQSILAKNPNTPMDLAFANGGVVDDPVARAQAALAASRAKYGGAPAEVSAPATQPVAQSQPQQAQSSSLIQRAGDLLRGRGAQIDKAAGYACGGKIKAHAQGGKITGPGTATSDSIPAKTSGGEDILVSNGERIVSVAQEQILERIAQMLGFATVDEMFAQMTGKPVGPTMKGGKKAAAQGAKDWNRVHMPGDSTSISYSQDTSTPEQQAQASADHEALATGAKKTIAAAADVITLPGRVISDGIGAAGNAGARLVNGVVGKPVITSRYQSTLANQGVTPFYDMMVRGDEPAPGQSAPAPTQQPTPAPEQQVKAEPAGAGATPTTVLPPDDLVTRQSMHQIHNNLSEFRDVGGGITAQRGRDGRLQVSNVGTQDITDPNKRAVDDSASAAIDRKGSTYDPQKQLEIMLRNRFMSDLTNPEITDPNVRHQALLGLKAMSDRASANLHEAQAGQANALTAQTTQMEQIRGKLLDPSTPAEERTRLVEMLNAISGKNDNEIKIAEAQTFDPANPMVPIKVPYGVKRNGQVFKVEDQYKAQQQKPTAPKFEVGKTYTDAKGNKAMYQADGSWKEIK